MDSRRRRQSTRPNAAQPPLAASDHRRETAARNLLRLLSLAIRVADRRRLALEDLVDTPGTSRHSPLSATDGRGSLHRSQTSI